MSFANYDYEAQHPAPAKTPQSVRLSDLDAAIRSTSEKIEAYGLFIAQFETQKDLVGTRRDGLALRTELDKLQREIAELGADIGKLVASLSGVASGATDLAKLPVSSHQKMLTQRLSAAFSDLHANFQRYARLYIGKKSDNPLRAPTSEHTPLLQEPASQQQQQQQQVQQEQVEETELQYHLLLTEQRNQEIERVGQGVREVNSIMQTLGDMVTQQGEQVDTIEGNIYKMHGNTQEASRELTKAHEYQKKKGKWSCIILVALCVFVLIMVLAVVS